MKNEEKQGGLSNYAYLSYKHNQQRTPLKGPVERQKVTEKKTTSPRTSSRRYREVRTSLCHATRPSIFQSPQKQTKHGIGSPSFALWRLLLNSLNNYFHKKKCNAV